MCGFSNRGQEGSQGFLSPTGTKMLSVVAWSLFFKKVSLKKRCEEILSIHFYSDYKVLAGFVLPASIKTAQCVGNHFLNGINRRLEPDLR